MIHTVKVFGIVNKAEIHVLTIVYSAAMNIGGHVFFQIVIFSNICLGGRLKGNMVALLLVS